MPHPRQDIRAAVVAALVGTGPSYNTAAATRVVPTRIVPWRQPELPAVAVYTLREKVEDDSKDSAPRELDRRLELAIEGCVKADVGVDDALDALALQIERVMAADATLGGKVSDVVLASTDIDVLETGELPLGVVRLVYDVRYFTLAPDPEDVELDSFKLADVRHSLGGQQNDPDDQSHDQVVLEGDDS